MKPTRNAVATISVQNGARTLAWYGAGKVANTPKLAMESRLPRSIFIDASKALIASL